METGLVELEVRRTIWPPMENKLSIARELLEPCRWIDRRETPFVLSDLATVFPAIGADDLQDLLERLAAVGFVRPVLD